MTSQYDDGSVDRAEILPLLGLDVKRNGQWLMTWCPAHNDGTKNGRNRNSLAGRSLGLSDRGVLRPFCGCTFKDVIEALRTAAGVVRQPSSNVTPIRKPPIAQAQDPGLRPTETVTAVYEYRNPDGQLVAEKARIENSDPASRSKRFMWRLPGVKGWPSSANGGGLQGMPIEETPLWGAELVAAAPPSEWVIYCEGEKATEACRQRGLLAVTHGGGASTRRFGVALDVLRDRRVALWPDNDEPGYRYMAAVSQHLKGVARQVRYIQVPLGPKEDAFDYFAKGGDPADIFKTVWAEPVVEHFAADHFRVTTFTEELGGFAFDFAEMSYERGERGVSAELTVSAASPGVNDEPYALRINLLSQSAREGLERQLKKQFGAANWTLAISQAYARARGAFGEQERGKRFADIDTSRTIEYVFGPYFAEGQHSLVFGDGASGKTMWTYDAALQMAMGVSPWGGQVKQTAGLIVDYETGEFTSRWRIGRLLRGMGYREEDLDDIPLFFWEGGGVPIAEQADSIRRFAQRHEIGFALVDHAALACGAPPEHAEAATGFFAGCARTGIPTFLTICHVSGQSDGLFPYGSRFWHNLARATYHFRAQKLNGGEEIDIDVIPRKQNEGEPVPSSSFKLAFGQGNSGPISIIPIGNRSNGGNPYDLQLADKVYALLLNQPRLKQYEIVQSVGATGQAVAAVLQDAARFRYIDNATARGAVRLWEAV